MKSPLEFGPLLELESVDSTQNVVAEALRSGQSVPGAVLAKVQTEGRGRLDRKWLSGEGDSLILSIPMLGYPNHPQPWLLGMAVATSVAAAIHARIQWPNDVSVNGKKVAGILNEVITDAKGDRIAVVGVGINLNQTEFAPEIADRATSLSILRNGRTFEPKEVLTHILERMESMPEPTEWNALKPVWMLFDATPGKKYKLSSGEEAIAIGIGPDGELICSVDGETQTVLAADAIFGESKVS